MPRPSAAALPSSRSGASTELVARNLIGKGRLARPFLIPDRLIPDRLIPASLSSLAGRSPHGKFRGPVQVRFALGNSLNIPAVKMLKAVGVGEMGKKEKKEKVR